MPPRWIAVALTPVVVLPVTGGIVTDGRVTPVVPAGAPLVVVAPPAAAVVAGLVAAVVGALDDFLLLLHAPSTIRLAAATATPFLIRATGVPPFGVRRGQSAPA